MNQVNTICTKTNCSNLDVNGDIVTMNFGDAKASNAAAQMLFDTGLFYSITCFSQKAWTGDKYHTTRAFLKQGA